MGLVEDIKRHHVYSSTHSSSFTVYNRTLVSDSDSNIHENESVKISMTNKMAENHKPFVNFLQ